MGSPQSAKWMTYLEENLLEEMVQPATSFFWCPHPLNDDADCSASAENCGSKNDTDDQEKLCPRKSASAENCGSKNDTDDQEKLCPRKRRPRDELCSGPGTKACREKMRRDRLNDRFMELSSVLDPGRPPKTDKGLILSDAVNVLRQLRSEAQKLKDSNGQLRETIKELKAEKNEFRDEKLRLKADKERLEQQLKAIAMPAGFLPHPAALHAAAAFAAQSQAASNKSMHAPGCQGMAMWQWMPPAVVDTSQDHMLRPPVA